LVLISKANGLGGEGLKSWYLRARYQTYDARGKPASKGVFEMYWGTRNQTRVSYTSDSFHQTDYRTLTGTYSTGNTGPVPYPELLIQGEFMRPVDLWEKAPAPKFREIKRDKVALSCLEVRIPEAPLASSYCVDAPRLLLRAMESDYYSAVYNQPAIFQHRFVAKQINLSDESQQVLDLDVDELRGLKPGDLPALTPPADAIKTGTSPIAGTEIDPRGGEPDRLANSAVMAGHIVIKVPPRYPQEAKQRRAQGSVRISATIGKDGLVHNAVVVHNPDEALSKAALDAVKQWRYTPYLLNGEPVDVRTYIRVTFTIGG